MNSIQMIPVEQLLHHPENPRKDLGDLTELADSIRKNGIMQNLTVVKGHMMDKAEWVAAAKAEGVSKEEALGCWDVNAWEPGGYTVVIGNRRMEAAKLAGLKELPCVISDMDYRTQIATMLEENMQRTDLTVFEQAQGFQMMMDLGLSEDAIGKITGFSRTTVRRRVEMAKLDPNILQKVGAQLTMDDMDRLAKIRDIETRNKLLKDAGTNNFKWKVDNALDEQTKEDNYKQIRAILLQAGCIEKSPNGIENFYREYEYLPYDTRVDLRNYKPGQNVLPEDERELNFIKEWNWVKFWAEKRKEEPEEADELTEEEIEKLKQQEEVRKAWAKLAAIEEHAKKSREEFLNGLTVKQKDNRKVLDWLLIALSVGDLDAWADMIPDSEEEEDDDLAYSLKWMRKQVETDPGIYAKVIGKMFFNGAECVRSRWRTEDKPVYERDISMATGYEWLEDFGYQTSDDERAYLDGTLDCYKEEDDE